MLLGLRHGPILRHRNLTERYHMQITELTVTSIQSTRTLTCARYCNARGTGLRGSGKMAPREFFHSCVGGRGLNNWER